MSRINYEGLVITTIELKGLPAGKKFDDLENGDKVTFNEKDGNEGCGACFLKDINQDMNESNAESERVFNATFVSPAEAAKIANAGFGPNCTPLFYVHGFNNEPGYTIGTMMTRAAARCKVESMFYPIPVIWPSVGSRLGYNEDQDKFSLKAGVNLACLVNGIPNDLIPKKTLLCHSMGNHVVFNGSSGKDLPKNPTGPPGGPPDVKFDNIFLCAADIDEDVFSKNPKNSGWRVEFEHKPEKAENMKAMLNTGGNIYVIHNEDDVALTLSISANWITRLGRFGAKNLRPGFENIVKNINAKPFTDNDPNPDDKDMVHSYQFEDWCVKIYENPEKYVS